MTDKNELILLYIIQLTISQFTHKKECYAYRLIKKELNYLSLPFFFFFNFPNDRVGRVVKNKAFYGYGFRSRTSQSLLVYFFSSVMFNEDSWRVI